MGGKNTESTQTLPDFFYLILNTSMWKQWQTLFWGGSKITVDGDCSHEIKRRLFLGRKAITNLDSLLKSRDITLPTKVHLVKAMVFPVVEHGCESWTINKAGRQRIDASELWCWRRLLRVPWMARLSNQSILKEISPKYSLEGLMLKLKLQYFGHLMWRTDPFEKTLMLGKIEGKGRRGLRRMRWFHSITNGDGQGGLVCCRPWGLKESDTTERLNWTNWNSPMSVWLRDVHIWGWSPKQLHTQPRSYFVAMWENSASYLSQKSGKESIF